MGLVTGSDCDITKKLNVALMHMGLAGEGLVDKRVWIVKTHYPERYGKTRFGSERAILLVRSPLDWLPRFVDCRHWFYTFWQNLEQFYWVGNRHLEWFPRILAESLNPSTHNQVRRHRKTTYISFSWADEIYFKRRNYWRHFFTKDDRASCIRECPWGLQAKKRTC